MAFVILGPGHYFHQAQYERPKSDDCLISVSAEKTPVYGSGHVNHVAGLRFLLQLCETVRNAEYKQPKHKADHSLSMRFAVPPALKEAREIPDEVDGVPVLANKAIPVSRYTEYFTNQTFDRAFDEKDVYEQWTERAETSMYLYDCENLDIYEIFGVMV